MTENATKAPTAAQIKTNHERTIKAVAKFNGRTWHGVRYLALTEAGKPGVIVVENRPYNSRNDEDFTETLRYETKVGQTIGKPTYGREYVSGNAGTICQGVADALHYRNIRRDALRSMENKVATLRAELAALEAEVAARKAELGIA